MMRHRGCLYRFFVVLLAWAFFASVILLPLAASGAMPSWAYGALGAGLLLLGILFEVGNELAIRHKNRVKP